MSTLLLMGARGGQEPALDARGQTVTAAAYNEW